MNRSVLLNSTEGFYDALRVRSPAYSGPYVSVTGLEGSGSIVADVSSNAAAIAAANTALGQKANASDVYTKSEVDGLTANSATHEVTTLKFVDVDSLGINTMTIEGGDFIAIEDSSGNALMDLDASFVTTTPPAQFFSTVNISGQLTCANISSTSITNALAAKVDDTQVLTNVPSGAVFTDTIYTHPATHSLAEVSGLSAALAAKVDNTQVLTNVPSGAVFTDTVYTHPATHSISTIAGLSAALAAKVDDAQVLTNVPANALFIDTLYNHSSDTQYVRGERIAGSAECQGRR